MSSTNHTLLLVAIMALVTAGIRFAPFVLFRKRTPQAIVFLGKVLPYAVISMLVVYCLKGVHVLTGNHGLPELIAILVVVVLHKWKHNTLLSILLGTICYMILVQVIFV